MGLERGPAGPPGAAFGNTVKFAKLVGGALRQHSPAKESPAGVGTGDPKCQRRPPTLGPERVTRDP